VACSWFCRGSASSSSNNRRLSWPQALRRLAALGVPDFVERRPSRRTLNRPHGRRSNLNLIPIRAGKPPRTQSAFAAELRPNISGGPPKSTTRLLSNFRDLSIQTSATFVISAGEPASARAIDLQEPTPRLNNACEWSPRFYLFFANDRYPLPKRECVV
jgi:hypothetical protein